MKKLFIHLLNLSKLICANFHIFVLVYIWPSAHLAHLPLFYKNARHHKQKKGTNKVCLCVCRVSK